MGRDRFLHLIKEFDDNYSPYINETKKRHYEELKKKRLVTNNIANKIKLKTHIFFRKLII